MAIKKIPAPTYVEEAETATSGERRNSRAAADALFDAFAWCDTAEGVEFWDGVYNRLIQISEDGILK